MPKYLALLFITFLFSTCSTEKNAFLNKSYHYVTVRYNGYFHGNEAFKEAKSNIQKAHQDDYNKIIPVFKYGDYDIASQQFDLLDRAIKKAVKMINKHSMVISIKREDTEVNAMIDNCYLLMGKAQFYKKDFESSTKTFKYVIKNFKKTNEYFESLLFLAQSYYFAENYVDYETKIKLIEEEKEFPKKFLSLYNQILTQDAIRNKDYNKAISLISKALETENKRRTKNRLLFLKGQLYQKIGNNREAAKNFELAAKKALDYELGFNAKLNYALTFQKESQEKVMTLLNKMLKDKKNEDYLDQIYFVKGTIFKNNNKKELAIENFKKSAWKSTVNTEQKAISYLELGNFAFDDKLYPKAQTYYDSSLQTLPKEYPNYEAIKIKTNSLTELVIELNNIKLQDSLLVLGNMNEFDRLKAIDEIIEQVTKKEAKQKEDELIQKQIALQKATQVNPAFGNQSASVWIFDNPQSIAAGYADFVTKWGERPLEDNWRRTKKSSDGFSNNKSNPEEIIEVSSGIDENKTPEYYLKQIPVTDKEKAASKESLKNSIYKVAEMYKFSLNDIPESNKYFERYLKEFSDSEDVLIAKYQLYRSYDKDNNVNKAAELREDILINYPNSEYASLIQNPNQFAENQESLKEMNAIYEKVFEVYKSKNYQATINEINTILNSSIENPLQGEFTLLKAFAKGYLENGENFEKDLIAIQTQYASTTTGSKATTILNRIKSNKDSELLLNMKNNENEEIQQFKNDSSNRYLFIIIIENEHKNEISNNIKTFNSQYYNTIPLSVEQEAFNSEQTLIFCSTFPNKTLAFKYYNEINSAMLSKIKNAGNSYFTISGENFEVLLNTKDVDEYRSYFKKNNSLK